MVQPAADLRMLHILIVVNTQSLWPLQKETETSNCMKDMTLWRDVLWSDLECCHSGSSSFFFGEQLWHYCIYQLKSKYQTYIKEFKYPFFFAGYEHFGGNCSALANVCVLRLLLFNYASLLDFTNIIRPDGSNFHIKLSHSAEHLVLKKQYPPLQSRFFHKGKSLFGPRVSRDGVIPWFGHYMKLVSQLAALPGGLSL